MKWTKVITLTAAVFCLAAIPVFAQGMPGESPEDMQMQEAPGGMQMEMQEVTLDNWSFEQKDQLVDKMNQAQENLSEQMSQAQQQDDTQKVSDLQQAEQSLGQTISQVQDANQDNWSQVRDQAESDLNDLTQYEGVIERGMFEPGAAME